MTAVQPGGSAVLELPQMVSGCVIPAATVKFTVPVLGCFRSCPEATSPKQLHVDLGRRFSARRRNVQKVLSDSSTQAVATIRVWQNGLYEEDPPHR